MSLDQLVSYRETLPQNGEVGAGFTCALVPRAEWGTFSGCPDPEAYKEQNKNKPQVMIMFLRQGLT